VSRANTRGYVYGNIRALHGSVSYVNYVIYVNYVNYVYICEEGELRDTPSLFLRRATGSTNWAFLPRTTDGIFNLGLDNGCAWCGYQDPFLAIFVRYWSDLLCSREIGTEGLLAGTGVHENDVLCFGMGGTPSAVVQTPFEMTKDALYSSKLFSTKRASDGHNN